MLGASPFIVFTSPYLERDEVRNVCTLLPYFKQPIFSFGKEQTKALKEELKAENNAPDSDGTSSHFVKHKKLA